MATGLVQIWVYEETRDILRKVAKAQAVTISDLVRSRFEDAEVTEKGYKREKEVDHALEGGDFDIHKRRVPKTKNRVVRPITVDNLYVPDTPKEWFELYGDEDTFLEFALAFEKKNGKNSWPGVETYYNNLHIG